MRFRLSSDHIAAIRSVAKDQRAQSGAGGFATGALVTALFLSAFGSTNVYEGGLSSHPDDLGGTTNHGITEQVAREQGWRGHMSALPLDSAKVYAYRGYWLPLRLDEIGEYAPRTARRLYDAGFNTGTGRAAAWLQTCLNVLNRKQEFYADIAVDRAVGPRTVGAVQSLYDRRKGGADLALETCVTGELVHHYTSISLAREANESFTYGWYLRARNLPTAP